jgi:hypothetical protein
VIFDQFNISSGPVLGVHLTFASDLAIQMLNIDYANDGRIFVLARGDAPTDNQIKVIEPLQPVAPEIAHTASQTVASMHEDVTFRADVSGPGPITYQWQHDRVDIPGANQPTLVIHNTDTTVSPGEYRLVATNRYGSSTSDPWSLTVVNRPRPDVTVTVSKDGEKVKTGDVIQFSAVATDAVDGTLPASRYSWTIVLHHNDHTHPLIEVDDNDHGMFTVGDYSYERGTLAIDLTLTVTNSAGLTRVVKKTWPISA